MERLEGRLKANKASLRGPTSPNFSREWRRPHPRRCTVLPSRPHAALNDPPQARRSRLRAAICAAIKGRVAALPAPHNVSRDRRRTAPDSTLCAPSPPGEEAGENGTEKMDAELEAKAVEAKAETVATESEAKPDASDEEAGGTGSDREADVKGADPKAKAEESDGEDEGATAVTDDDSEEEAAETVEEDGGESDTEGDAEESPPSPPRRSRRRKRAATPDDETEENPTPSRRRCRRKSGERGDSQPPLPDHLRCRRSDGKKWRCSGRALPTVSFCEYHYTRASKGKKLPADEEVLVVVLQRHKNKRKGRRSINPPTSPQAATSDPQTRDLPNGLMTISPASSGPAALSTPVKIGVEIPAPIQRCYRSKNVEPLHVGPVKVVPRAMSVTKTTRTCHCCGMKKAARVANYKNCDKNFCNSCINKWWLRDPGVVGRQR
eukprot:XP_020400330.1 growth-regulating factor 11 [Zea mays]